MNIDNSKTIKKLQDAGYKVRINHNRYLSIAPNKMFADGHCVNNLFDYYGGTTGLVSNQLFTKPEQIKAMSGCDGILQVSEYGGETVVTLTRGKGFETFSSKCHKDDKFNSKLGVHIALQRGIDGLNQRGLI